MEFRKKAITNNGGGGGGSSSSSSGVGVGGGGGGGGGSGSSGSGGSGGGGSSSGGGSSGRITLGLNTNFTLSPSYSFQKSSGHKSCFLSLFIFRGHSTRKFTSGRATYFTLRA